MVGYPCPMTSAHLVMDGHVEGHSEEEIEEILSACGNDAATLSLWKQKGML